MANGAKQVQEKDKAPEPKIRQPPSIPFVHRVREVACGEIALPVWDSFGGPKNEPPRK